MEDINCLMTFSVYHKSSFVALLKAGDNLIWEKMTGWDVKQLYKFLHSGGRYISPNWTVLVDFQPWCIRQLVSLYCYWRKDKTMVICPKAKVKMLQYMYIHVSICVCVHKVLQNVANLWSYGYTNLFVTHNFLIIL